MSSQAEYLAQVEVRPEAWLRRRWRGRILAFVALVVGIGGVVLCALAFADSGSVDQPAWETALYGFLAADAFALIPLAFAWRMATAGVWVGRDEVVIRGPLRTWRISHSESERFRPGCQYSLIPWYPGVQTIPCPMLGRAGRSPVGVWALANDFSNSGHHMDELELLCERLNEALDAGRPATAPGLSPAVAP